MDETWLYHYNPETKKQSTEWRHNSSARPPPKNSAGKVLDSIFFGIKTAPSTLIIFQRAKLLTRSINLLCWLIWRTFEGKTPPRGKVTNVVLFLYDNVPSHRALATQKKLAYLGFYFLHLPPYSPHLAPSDYHLFPGLKKRLKVCHFFFFRNGVNCWSGDLVGRRKFWIFFSGLKTLEQRFVDCAS
jgi:histone-lysine N-methyltransferase SETMAR